MTTDLAIRTRLQATLEAIVPPIGQVHTYHRYSADQAALRALYQDPLTQALKAWTISRESRVGQRQPPSHALRFPVYVLRGYRILNDAEASEILFSAEVDAVLDAIAEDLLLGGLVDHLEEPQLRVQDHRMFGGALCHYAEVAVKLHLPATYTLRTV